MPITAGKLSSKHLIDICEFTPPYLVTNPFISELNISTIIESLFSSDSENEDSFFDEKLSISIRLIIIARNKIIIIMPITILYCSLSFKIFKKSGFYYVKIVVQEEINNNNTINIRLLYYNFIHS